MYTRYLLFYVAPLLLYYQSAIAAVDPSTLVKVSPDNNVKCVEYYNYNGDMYCSTKAQDATPVNPAIKDYEKLKIVFDERPWRIGWGEKNDVVQTVEYVTGDETVENWNELITSSFLPGMQKKASPLDWANNEIEQLKAEGFTPITKIIKQTPNQVIFEFRIVEPKNQQQDELQMITSDDTGLYILHYVIKKPDMGEEARAKWIKILENASIAK